MVRFIPIRYRNKKYPDAINPKIEEIPAHFDCKDNNKVLFSNLDYSLHTEYSYGPRKFRCPVCGDLLEIKTTDNKGVPKLWFNYAWVKDFIQFIFKFVGNKKSPVIIEIHPPFNDYCDLSRFIELYKYFEDEILSTFHRTKILIENRYGSRYRGQYGDEAFVLSKTNELKELVCLIRENNLKLRIALDIPQLFSAHNLNIGEFSKDKLLEIFRQLHPIRRYIASIHLWGKCIGKNNKKSSHMGTLDSYFMGLKCKDILAINASTLNSYTKVEILDADVEGISIKEIFLKELYNLLNDGRTRYFLPEVNSRSEHLQAIVKDLINYGFKFV